MNSNLIEAVLKDYVFIDANYEPHYDSDQMYVDYPCVFATVRFMLMATSLLTTLADRIRKDMGFAPVNPMDEYTDKTCDDDAWYEFYYGINAVGAGVGDSCIEVVVCNASSPDDGSSYYIHLSDSEREEMYERINEQCIEIYGKSNKQLLTESYKAMQEDGADSELFPAT